MRKPVPASLRRWFSRWLAIQIFVVLGLVSAVIYVSTYLNLSSHQQTVLQDNRKIIEHFLQRYAETGDFLALDHTLKNFFLGHPGLSLRLTLAGTTYRYGMPEVSFPTIYFRDLNFYFSVPERPDVRIMLQLSLDVTSDRSLGASLAWILCISVIVGALIMFMAGACLVRRVLLPVKEVCRQVGSLSSSSLSERLDESGLAVEIKPLVASLNAVLQRLEQAYVQMDEFNADVAHELRTPLTNLVGETEYALAGKRSAAQLHDILGSNLEELQRMAAIINDMLFLSQAGRGGSARTFHTANLCDLTLKVIDYHAAEASEAHVALKVVGNEIADVDGSLFQRAISNLVSNAIRYSISGTEVIVTMTRVDANYVRLTVCNQGPPIAAHHLPHLFQRFYRIACSREDDVNHHGLGLAIVAAIARMHGGDPFAQSSIEGTEIGFTVAVRFS